MFRPTASGQKRGLAQWTRQKAQNTKLTTQNRSNSKRKKPLSFNQRSTPFKHICGFKFQLSAFLPFSSPVLLSGLPLSLSLSLSKSNYPSWFNGSFWHRHRSLKRRAVFRLESKSRGEGPTLSSPRDCIKKWSPHLLCLSTGSRTRVCR